MPRDFFDEPSNRTKPFFVEFLTPAPRYDDLPLRSGREYYDTPAQAINHVERHMRNHPDVLRGEIFRAGRTADSHHTKIDIVHQADLIPGNFDETTLEDVMNGDMDDIPAMHY